MSTAVRVRPESARDGAPAQPPPPAWAPLVWRAALTSVLVLVVVTSDRVVGYATLDPQYLVNGFEVATLVKAVR